MRIALIGYGRMGHEIESIAIKRNHSINLIIDQDNASDINSEKLKDIDVAIEFSSPSAAFDNINRCLENSVPVVSGTTGWLENYAKAVETCKRNGTSFIHSSNFSIGVNLLFMLNAELAKRMEGYHEYNASVEEIHHVKKLDAPSGTALKLVEGITGGHSLYDGWCPGDTFTDGKVPVSSVREGMVPGTHIVTWDSEVDSITLKHEAKSRQGFALGAVIAAEFIHDKHGIFTMRDVMGF